MLYSYTPREEYRKFSSSNGGSTHINRNNQEYIFSSIISSYFPLKSQSNVGCPFHRNRIDMTMTYFSDRVLLCWCWDQAMLSLKLACTAAPKLFFLTLLSSKVEFFQHYSTPALHQLLRE